MMKKNSRGFTLIELMIVVVIIAILASLGTAYFGDNVISARRTDGRTALLNTTTSLEKCKAIYGNYDDANCGIQDGDAINSPEGHYSVAVDTTNNGIAFTLTATPTAGSTQNNDTECTSIILNNLGQQTGTGTDWQNNCW